MSFLLYQTCIVESERPSAYDIIKSSTKSRSVDIKISPAESVGIMAISDVVAMVELAA